MENELWFTRLTNAKNHFAVIERSSYKQFSNKSIKSDTELQYTVKYMI